jgi:phospholipid/cholesterol/gamma-HCH transport system substrate-binding protein
MQNKAEFKVGLFIIVLTLLIVASIGYVAYKKGVFTRIFTYTLSSKSGDDLTVGMPVVFSGFTIGKVSDMELSDSGVVLITIKVPERHIKWLKADSKFIINKPLVGASRIVVATTNLKSPPLSTEAITEVETATDITQIVSSSITPILDKVNQIATHLEQLTARIADPQGDINVIVRDAKKIADKMSQKESFLEMAIDDPQSVRAIQDSLRKMKDITAKADSILKTVDAMAVKAEAGMYGQDGVIPAIAKILKDLLGKLQKLDITIDNINKISSDAAGSTTNLKVLRNEIDMTINSIKKLSDDLDRILPPQKEPEIKLP